MRPLAIFGFLATTGSRFGNVVSSVERLTACIPHHHQSTCAASPYTTDRLGSSPTLARLFYETPRSASSVLVAWVRSSSTILRTLGSDTCWLRIQTLLILRIFHAS